MLHSCWPLTCPLHVCGKLYIFITLGGLCLIFTLWFLVVFAVWTTDGLIFIISPLFIKWRLYSFCWLSSEVCFHFFTSAQNPPSHYFFPVQTFLLFLKSHTASFLHKWSSCWDQMGIHSLSTFASNLLHLSKWHWWWSCFTSFSHNTTTTILHSLNVHSLNEFCMIM